MGSMVMKEVKEMLVVEKQEDQQQLNLGSMVSEEVKELLVGETQRDLQSLNSAVGEVIVLV